MKLSAPTDQLPLAFGLYGTLTEGRPESFLGEAGRLVVGSALDAALSLEGVGLKTVTFSGLYVAEGGGELLPWTRTTRLAGTLDGEGLARLGHQEARQFIESFRAGKNRGTPPESYITAIEVSGAPLSLKKRRRRRVVIQPERIQTLTGVRVVYRAPNGQFTTKSQWQRQKRVRARKGKRPR